MSDGPKNGFRESGSDLASMHRDLVALTRQLEESIDRAPDAAAIAAITDQITEVNARVTSTGRLLLIAQTDEIARLAGRVRAAMPDIAGEIERLEDVRRIVGGVTAMLGVVDETLRVANEICR